MYIDRYGRGFVILWRQLACCAVFIFSFASSVHAAPQPLLWEMWQQPAATVELPADKGFAEFLAQYRRVNQEGIAVIDYARVTPVAIERLEAFVASYIGIDPRGLPKQDQFVYWVNLYNAQIILQILDAGIPESIRDIRPGLSGLLAGGPWKKTQFQVAGQDISFNDIEHRILRPIWRDARVHFVLNCASIGCPDIPDEPLAPEKLEQQLEGATMTFMRHSRAVSLVSNTLTLSRLFDWFANDFGADEAARIGFINRYLEKPITSYNSISYAYDWALNAPQAAR